MEENGTVADWKDKMAALSKYQLALFFFLDSISISTKTD